MAVVLDSIAKTQRISTTRAFTHKQPQNNSISAVASRQLSCAGAAHFSVPCSGSSSTEGHHAHLYGVHTTQQAQVYSTVHFRPQRQFRTTSRSRTSTVFAAAGEAGDAANSTNNNPSSSSSSSTKSGGFMGMLQQWNQDTKRLRQQLQSLGLAGVVAYGMFNTAYYTVAFLVVWFTVANVPAGLGLQASARKAAEVFALVWAGSQVTKLLRAGGALAFAPVVDRGLAWAVTRLKLRNKQQAFLLVVMVCCLLAMLVFGCVVAMHA